MQTRVPDRRYTTDSSGTAGYPKLVSASIAVLALLAGLVLPLVGLREKQRARTYDIGLATATEGGSYQQFGKQLARVLEEMPNSRFSHVTAVDTAGAYENIERIRDGDVELALVGNAVLVDQPGIAADVAIVARLFDDVAHVIVRDAKIGSVADLVGRRVYLGRAESGTRHIMAQLLERAGVAAADLESMLAQTGELSYKEAAEEFVAGNLDALMFASGRPTPSAKLALDSEGARLLDLGSDLARIRAEPGAAAWFSARYASAVIPEQCYSRNQPRIATFGTTVFLVAGVGLEETLVSATLDALYDNIDTLVLAHSRSEDIRFESPENDLPEGFAIHAGTRQFWDDEADRLWILTGTIGGRYYNYGRNIQRLLAHENLRSRVVHTDGSLDNARLLTAHEPAIAIMQYDAALASYWNAAGEIYDIGPTEASVQPVKNMRRLATLHQEKVHILMRRERHENYEAQSPREPLEADVGALRGLAVSLGPERSASQLMARAILTHHGIEPTLSYASVLDMVTRLQSGQLDAGFFTSGVPSHALGSIIDDEDLLLVSIAPRAMTKLTPFHLEQIDTQYGCQLEGEGPIETIATTAVLVTTDDMPHAYEIARALIDGIDFLELDGKLEQLKKQMAGIPMHEDAARYYREKKLLPAEPDLWVWLLRRIDVVAKALGLLLVLLGAWKGLLKIRRDTTANEIGRRIFHVSVSASEPHSVQCLHAIRTEIGERVKRRWWLAGEIDKTRWRVLEDLVSGRVAEAKENLRRALLCDVRALRDERPAEPDFPERVAALKHRSWEHLENGELDEPQHGLINKLLDDLRPVGG